MRRIGTILFCAALVVACGQHNETVGHGGPIAASGDQPVKILRRGLLGEPLTLDPQLADDTYSLQVVRDLYEGLTAEDRNGQIVPGTASSWTVDSSGKVYIFSVRENARWSNGTRIVADDFVQGLRRAVDPNTASGAADTLVNVKNAADIIAGRKNVSDLGVVAIDNSTVKVELERPAPFILEVLAQPIAAPFNPHAISANNAANYRNSTTNGPYILVARIPGSYIELVRNPYYWDAAHVAIAKVRYIDSESEATELREYLSGELDLTFTIPLPDLQSVSQQYPTEVQNEPFLGTVYLALNLTRAPLKNNRGLRQALSMSLDREIICSRVMMGMTPAYAFVAKGVNGYTPAVYSWSDWTRDHQLAEAKSLYEKAGYSIKKPLKLKLYFNQDEGIRRLMIAIAGSWKQNLGIESELISDEFRVFLVGRKDRSRWDVARLGWTADYNDPANFLDIFSNGSNQNDPGYESPDFRDSVNRAENEPINEQRMRLLRNSEQLLLDDYPVIPIYFYRARRLVKPYVGGAQLTPMNRTYSKHLYWK